MPTPLGREPLLGYLRVQMKADRAIIKHLNAAAAQTSRDIAALRSARGIGAQVRRAQLLQTLTMIRREQAAMWRAIGNEINARRADAAAEAARQATNLDKLLFRSAGGDRKLLAALARANEATATSGLEALGVRLRGDSRHELSMRVYKNASLGSGRIDTLVNSSLAEGLNAREIATKVRRFIRPGTPGGVSYAALRLGRTELNNAYHAISKQVYDKPWVNGVRWELSGSHPRPDECNDYAEHDDGLGPGVYRPIDVPDKPHPQCLCFTTPVTATREEFISAYRSGAYDDYLSNIGA